MAEQQLERGQQWLTEFLTLANLAAPVAADMRESYAETSCWLTIDHTHLQPTQIEHLLGPNGHVLDSIQYLANTLLNLGQSADQQGAYIIELAGHRQQRQQVLLELAETAAEQVRQTGAEYEMPALSSAERRQIHTILKEQADLETFSRGQEPDRRLVVQLVSPASDSD
jgi:spoIIIJ-associated protein